MKLSLESLLTDMLLLVLLAAVSLLGVSYWSGRIRQDERVKAQAEMQAAWEKKLDAVRQVASNERLRQGETYARNLDSVQRQRDAALNSLRKRPSRAEQAIPARGACPAVPACTGDRLAKDDAEFLTRFAARAAEQQAQLIEARAGFETCSQALKNATSGASTEGTQNGTDRGPPD